MKLYTSCGIITSNYGVNELKAAIDDRQITLYSVKNKLLVDNLYGRLHRGELEVIIAAKELKVKSVILDDRLARAFAESMLLKPIGIIGILIIAKQMGRIPEVKQFLDKLISSGYRISISLYNQALKMADEI